MARISRVSSESMDVKVEMINRLKEIAPGIFEEGKIDFDKLKSLLGPSVDSREEKYSFTWAGRKDALLSLQTTSKGTLIPDQTESVNFDTTENVFIEGDNLEALKLLQKSYFGKIKMIYIDPPYNTGKDFIYKDDFRSGIKSYLQQTGQANGDSIKLTTNLESNGRFHSDWLTMIYPRLFLARNLLRDDGVIFISMDDNEAHNLRMVLNEIFGEENFVAQLPTIMNMKGNNDEYAFAGTHEYTFVYSKTQNGVNFREFLINDKTILEDEWEIDQHGYFKLGTLKGGGKNGTRIDRPNLFFPIYVSEHGDWSLEEKKGFRKILPISDGKEMTWRWSKEKILAEPHNVLVTVKDGDVVLERKIRPDNNIPTKKPKTLFYKPEYSSGNGVKIIKELFDGKRIFEYSKPVNLIRDFIEISTEKNDIVIDFFAGSGTTAQALLEINAEDNLNRKFILVQLPEQIDKKSIAGEAGFKNIAEITKERIRLVIKKIVKESTQQKLSKKQKLDLGFKVFKLAKSNFKIWENFEGKDSSKLKKQMSLFKNALISGAKDIDVIFECAIKEGFNLNTKIEKVPCKSQTVYQASDDSSKFYICLDEKIKSNLADELKLTKETQLFCLDEALSDSQKMNLSLQCRLKTI